MKNIKALQDALHNITLQDITILGNDCPSHLFFLLNSCSFALSEDTQKKEDPALRGGLDPSIFTKAWTTDDAQAFLNWYDRPEDFFTLEEIKCMKEGRKLAAIRLVKDLRDCGLHNAKLLVEEGMRRWFPSTKERATQPVMYDPFNAEKTVQDIENSREFYEGFFTYTERSSMTEGFLNSAIALVRKRLDITSHEASLVVNAGMRMWSRKA